MFRKSVRERSWQRGKGTQQLTLGGWGKRVDEHTADLGPDVRTPPRHPHEEQPEEREVSDAHSAQGTEIKGFKFAKEELLIGFRADAGLVTSLSVSPCGVKLFSQKSPSLIISKKGWEHIQSQRKYYFSQTHTHARMHAHTQMRWERENQSSSLGALGLEDGHLILHSEQSVGGCGGPGHTICPCDMRPLPFARCIGAEKCCFSSPSPFCLLKINFLSNFKVHNNKAWIFSL